VIRFLLMIRKKWSVFSPRQSFIQDPIASINGVSTVNHDRCRYCVEYTVEVYICAGDILRLRLVHLSNRGEHEISEAIDPLTRGGRTIDAIEVED
jgi:hypothetical protein